MPSCAEGAGSLGVGQRCASIARFPAQVDLPRLEAGEQLRDQPLELADRVRRALAIHHRGIGEGLGPRLGFHVALADGQDLPPTQQGGDRGDAQVLLQGRDPVVLVGRIGLASDEAVEAPVESQHLKILEAPIAFGTDEHFGQSVIAGRALQPGARAEIGVDPDVFIGVTARVQKRADLTAAAAIGRAVHHDLQAGGRSWHGICRTRCGGRLVDLS
jgi:hypothetical protein